VAVGASGRAPGWGAGGWDVEEDAVVVAGAGKGVVRVDWLGFRSAVWGVMPSGFAAVEEMGSFLWRGIGGMAAILRSCISLVEGRFTVTW